MIPKNKEMVKVRLENSREKACVERCGMNKRDNNIISRISKKRIPPKERKVEGK
jgi:hypothetical protein